MFSSDLIILMSYAASDVETGVYSAALRIIDVFAVVPFLLNSSTFPILRSEERRVGHVLFRSHHPHVVRGVGRRDRVVLSGAADHRCVRRGPVPPQLVDVPDPQIGKATV